MNVLTRSFEEQYRRLAECICYCRVRVFIFFSGASVAFDAFRDSQLLGNNEGKDLSSEAVTQDRSGVVFPSRRQA